MCRGLQLQNTGHDIIFNYSRSPLTKAQSSLKKIISNISRLQDEKQKLLTKYENAMDEIERMKSDAQLKEEMESKQYTAMCNTRRVTVCNYFVVCVFCIHVLL